MTETGVYEQLTANFNWSVAERQLGYRPGEPINIGWMCSDRICQLGKAAAILGLYLRPRQHAEELVGLQGRDNNVGSATGTVGQSALRGLKGSEEPPYPVLHRSRSFDVKIAHLGAAPAFRRHEPRYE
jgi:hypothetical protein